MQDKILVTIAIVALILFCGLVIVFVAEPDLIIITALVLLLALNDFWISVFRPTRPTVAGETTLEQRPTGVSGKTLTSAKDNFAAKGSKKKA
ncbi:MAG: hypothetical protein VX871_09835 [Pseudomonadota bacterium]|nr:hypothetical protein [Pseudomonadota bacterium]